VNLIFVPDLSSLFAAKKASYEDLIIGGAKISRASPHKRGVSPKS
jgi:hypothetical protein